MTEQAGLERQIEILVPDELEAKPSLPVSFEQWEERAQSALPRQNFDYIAGGAGAEETVRKNRSAFEIYDLLPRMLQNVSQRTMDVTVLGTSSAAPFFLAPVGVQSVMHPDGELATARAAANAGIPFTLSTVASSTIEDVADLMGAAPRWFQLYPSRDPEVSASFIRRAETSGYSALVVTLDTTMFGWRERDLRNAYFPFLRGEGLANYLSDPVFRSQLSSTPEEDPKGAIAHFFGLFVNPAFGWSDLDHIRSLTRLPLVLKGMLRADDARNAFDRGVDGIIVSNHGGRQVDGAIAALDALRSVVEGLGDEGVVLMDSGIRRASDVFKALALGAKAVFIGRPYAFGLAVAGEEGVAHVIRNLMAEIDLQLGLCGLTSIAQIDSSLLRIRA